MSLPRTFKLAAFLSLIVAMGFSAPLKATTYDINLMGPLPAGVSYGPDAGFSHSNACSATSCAGGIHNPVYTFEAQPGDTLDFGTLRLATSSFSDQRQQAPGGGYYIATYGTELLVSFSFQTNPTLFPAALGVCISTNPGCFFSSPSYGSPIDLTYTLGDSGYIQLTWTDPSIYTPPAFTGAVPEPSTWATMLLGFAGVGFMAYRRKRKLPLMAA